MTRTLSQWLEYIGGIHVSAIDMGLERVLPVASYLGIVPTKTQQDKTDKKPIIFTVAGTNGKGSTTKTIAAICEAGGLKTALYQSPHLVSFTERICINGNEISESDLVVAFEAVENARVAKNVTLSFFEMTTLAAFWHFNQKKCDVWVLEIGLGGRLDVVNIIDPDVAVITNIGIDHVDWLGDDIERIGQEKAGIIRENIPVILGARQLPNSVHELANRLTKHVHQLGVNYDYMEQGETWIFSNAALTIQLPKPKLSLQNAVNAVAAVLESGIKIHLDSVIDGLHQVQLAGRFDRRIINDRHWIFDVAHNSHGIRFFLVQWADEWHKHKKIYPDAKLKVIFSMLGDKDVDAVLEVIKAALDDNKISIHDWSVAAINHPRAMDLQTLLGHVHTHIKPSNFKVYQDLAQAAQSVSTDASTQDLIVVFGSFHTISETLVALLGIPY